MTRSRYLCRNSGGTSRRLPLKTCHANTWETPQASETCLVDSPSLFHQNRYVLISTLTLSIRIKSFALMLVNKPPISYQECLYSHFASLPAYEAARLFSGLAVSSSYLSGVQTTIICKTGSQYILSVSLSVPPRMPKSRLRSIGNVMVKGWSSETGHLAVLKAVDLVSISEIVLINKTLHRVLLLFLFRPKYNFTLTLCQGVFYIFLKFLIFLLLSITYKTNII